MRDQLYAARNVLAQTNLLNVRITQQQNAVDAQLEQIRLCEKRRIPLDKKMRFHINDKGVRVGIKLLTAATALLLLHIFLIWKGFGQDPDSKIGSNVFFAFLWLSPLAMGAGLWVAFFKGRAKRKALLTPILDQLQYLKEGEGFRCRTKWLSEIEALTAQRDQILDENQRTLAFLPESCWSLEAVEFIIDCFGKNTVTELSDAVQIWDLTVEQANLCHQLESEEARGKILDKLLHTDPSKLLESFYMDGAIVGVLENVV